MAEQKQFLDVIDRDTAQKLFHQAIELQPLECENVPLAEALGRVLAADIISQQNVPSFDRSNYCLLYTSPSPRDGLLSRMPSSA